MIWSVDIVEDDREWARPVPSDELEDERWGV